MKAYIKVHGYDALQKIFEKEFKNIDWENVWRNGNLDDKGCFFLNISQDTFYENEEDVCFF